MQHVFLLLWSCLQLWCYCAEGQITQPPVNTTAPLNTNVSFTCQGSGDLVWEVNRVQVRNEVFRDAFRDSGIYIPLGDRGFSEMVVFGSLDNNATLVQCLRFEGTSVEEESEVVSLTLYGSPNPPSNLQISTLLTDVVLSWDEPFAIAGEDISYVVTATNRATQQTITRDVDVAMATISESIGERDCGEYEFRVKSRNGFGTSSTGVTGTDNIPTVPRSLRNSDIQLTVSFTAGLTVRVEFNAPSPCSRYPITSYNISFEDQSDSSASFTTPHVPSFEDVSLVIDSQNSGLQPNRKYLVSIESENLAGSSTSEPVQLYTTGLQSSLVVVELNGSASVSCTFAPGSEALGCEVSFYTSSSMEQQLLFAQNITRDLAGSNTAASENIPLMGRLEGRTHITVQAAEILTTGTVSSVPIEAQLMDLSIPSTSSPDTTSTMDSPSTAATDQTTTPGGGGSGVPLGDTLYIIIGGVAGFILVVLLLIIVVILIICSLNRRNKTRAEYLGRANSLKDNNAYGTGVATSPVLLTEATPLENGLHTRNNTYYEKPMEEEATNGVPPPMYETIPVKKADLAGGENGVSSSMVPNPVYGAAGRSETTTQPSVANPVYAEAVTSGDGDGPKAFADISGLNPVYSGTFSSPSDSSPPPPPPAKNYESAVPLPAMQDTGPRYGNAPLHAGPGIPASAAMDLIRASEGTPLRRATGSPPPESTAPAIYEEIRPKVRTLSNTEPERGGVDVFPLRSLSHTEAEGSRPPGFPLLRNESYGMLVAPDSQPSTPRTPAESAPPPPIVPKKTSSLSSSGPHSPSEQSPPPSHTLV